LRLSGSSHGEGIWATHRAETSNTTAAVSEYFHIEFSPEGDPVRAMAMPSRREIAKRIDLAANSGNAVEWERPKRPPHFQNSAHNHAIGSDGVHFNLGGYPQGFHSQSPASKRNAAAV
jgi:hypothetical protein